MRRREAMQRRGGPAHMLNRARRAGSMRRFQRCYRRWQSCQSVSNMTPSRAGLLSRPRHSRTAERVQQHSNG